MVSKRLETAQKYISHFATLDTQLLSSLLADSYIQEFAPRSLNLPHATLDKQGMLNHIASLHAIMKGFPVTAKEYIESDVANQVTVWCTSRVDWREDVLSGGAEGTAEWEYEGEYVFMLWMDESGERIVRTVEFLDSKNTREKLSPLMKRAREVVEKRSGAEER